MIGLFTSEWLRFRSRKLIRWLAILAIVGIVVGAVLAGIGSQKASPDMLARAERRSERFIARCIENKNGGFYDELPPGETADEYCREVYPAAGFVGVDQLALAELPEYMQGAGFIVMLIGLVVGASAVGASWQSGTITTILTWEPRRIRWLATRLATVIVGVFLLTMALLLIFALLMALAAALRGSTSTDPGWLADVAGTAIRIAAVAVALALLGAAVATIGRNTAAALGAVFVYMAVFESVVRGLRPALGRFMLGDSIATVVTASELEIFQGDRVFVITPGHGAVVIVAYVIVLIALAALALRARDIQ